MLWYGMGRVKAHDLRHKCRNALHLIYAGPFTLTPPGIRAPDAIHPNPTQPKMVWHVCFTNPNADAERQIGQNEADRVETRCI